ncbi:MAG TPA: hypothetical protein VFS21_31095 [Roseiflexaceae bacterium]|nr:hypothetical protein [Roseiflexaceae bacterium]
MKFIRLHPDFAKTIARYNIGMNEMADLAGIGRPTLFTLQNPASHGWRRGGMRPVTAWKIVNAFADKTGIAPDQAWEMLLVETDEPRQPRRKTDTQDVSEADDPEAVM